MLVTSAVALAEKVPDPELRPHGFEIEKGGLLDLDEAADQLVACGYERVDQVENRGQFALRGDILDVYPATEERAVRCELFDVEVERLTWFSTFTQRSLEEAERVEIAPAAELAPEQRELAEIAATSDESERPDVADVLPVDRFRELLDLVPENALIAVAAEEELAPSLRDYWEDVTTSFHDEDAHHLYVPPDRLDARARRARRAAAVEHLPGPAARVPRAERRHGGALAARGRARAREAGALRLPHVRRLDAPRRGRAGPLQPDPAPRRVPGRQAGVRRSRASRSPTPGCARASWRPGSSSRSCPSTGCCATGAPSARPGRSRRRRRDRLVHRAARRRRGGPRGPRHREVRGLRDEDGRRDHPRLPRARVQGRRPRVRAERPAAQGRALRGRRRRRPAAVEARRQAVGADEAPRPPRRRGARRRADQPLRRAPPPGRPRVRRRRRVADGVRGALPLPRDARPDGRDRGGAGGHGGGAPDGPPDLRRRGLRQDGGGAARRVQGGGGRQAGDVPRADDGARPAALRHLHRAHARLPGAHRGGLALPLAEGGARRAEGLLGRHRRRDDRDPPAALARRAAEGPRPPDRGRGAALRREAEGAAAPAPPARGRALAVGHADPAHAPDVAGRAARHLGDRDAAGGPPAR